MDFNLTQNIVATIKGKVVDIEKDSYKDKSGQDQESTRVVLETKIGKITHSFAVRIPKESKVKEGDMIDHQYKIYCTKSGVLIANPV